MGKRGFFGNLAGAVRRVRHRVLLPVFVITLGVSLYSLRTMPGEVPDPEYLNLADFARRYCWTDDLALPVELKSWDDFPAQCQSAGLVWDEERDVRELRVHVDGEIAPGDIQVFYWFRNWPYPPPEMPTIEDPLDDIWQGEWLRARTVEESSGGVLTLRFPPLEKGENPLADNLPESRYRRTMKIRIGGRVASRMRDLQVFSESTLSVLKLRIQFGAGVANDGYWSGGVKIYNGVIDGVEPRNFTAGDTFLPPHSWSRVAAGGDKGIVAAIRSANAAPAGSNDLTVVTVEASATEGDGRTTSRSFSFMPADLAKGPIYIPAFHAHVSRADDHAVFSEQQGLPEVKTIRERIAMEKEQSFERASLEIPPLNPWVRQDGRPVYLPLAADASWQKFAVEYGGNIFVSKKGTKAKGRELKRLLWQGDRIDFRIGTGDPPYYRDDHKAQVSIVEGSLPVVVNRWQREGLDYTEETFATLLEGPLDPTDRGRDEQTSAVLMVKLGISNPAEQSKRAQVTFGMNPPEELEVIAGQIRAIADTGGRYDSPRLRAVLSPTAWTAESGEDETSHLNSIVRSRVIVPGRQTRTFYFFIPFVSDLAEPDARKLEKLEYEEEREKVIRYWSELIGRTVQFTTPEPKFDLLARSVVAHIHMGTTKDPRSGLFMVPAATYNYQVYANESCFQILFLDSVGDTERATRYLKTLTELQGTRDFPGNYSEPHDGVLHGARVDSEYDYTASNYGLDHGTVLWTLARHYLYTRDAGWLDEALPHMFAAVDWIERQRELTRRTDVAGERVLEYGLLPAGHLEDNRDWGYWFAVNAYCVAGLREMARALRDVSHPAAERIQQQFSDYRKDLRRAVLHAVRSAPVTRLRDGSYSPYVPTRQYQRFRHFGPLRVQYYSRYGRPDILPCFRLSATRELLYGPLILLKLGIFDPGEPFAEWVLDDWEDNLTLSSSGGFNVHGFTDDNFWFSQGGMVFQPNLQNPVQVYLRRREVAAAIRALYNNFVSCLYPDVSTLTEEYRMWERASGPFYKSPDEARFVNGLRDFLVFEVEDDLWLGSGIPRRWLLENSQGVRVDRMNSYFGPLSLQMGPGKEENSIRAVVTPPVRNPPANLWLYVRVPEGKRIEEVIVDGRKWTDFEADRERVRLPTAEGQPLSVLVRF